jgi:hypothetical protein
VLLDLLIELPRFGNALALGYLVRAAKNNQFAPLAK